VDEPSLQDVQRLGAGLGKAVRVLQGSTSNARNALVMYAIVQGDSKEAVAKAPAR
jgi:hypothetical protein